MTRPYTKKPAIAAALAIAFAPLPAFAQTASNTALTQYQADQILNGGCSLSAKYASDAAVRRGEERDMYRRWANNILISHITIPRLQSMMDIAYKLGASGNRDEREISEFQVCILETKMKYIN